MSENSKKNESFVDVAFIYNGSMYHKRIYTKDIDKNQYDNSWTHIFKSGSGDHDSVVFEITGTKNESGQLECMEMYVNVYSDEDQIEPIWVIDNVQYKKSWIDRKSFS